MRLTPFTSLTSASPTLKRLAALLGLTLALPASAEEGPGLDAIREFREGRPPTDMVQNRFFLRAERFELAPSVGYVPNNSFAERYVGNLFVAYHFSEILAAEGVFGYSPDLGVRDLKGLTREVLRLAETTQGGEFQQPLDKVIMSASFGARYTPLYGKINLIGETVLNFDVYGVAGLSMLSNNLYYGTWDSQNDQVILHDEGNEVKIGPQFGIGSNFFLSQSLALKLDARASFYVGDAPNYDRDAVVTDSRLYNHFVTSAGLAVFFPRMPSRQEHF